MFRPARALKRRNTAIGRELLAMTPGTDQFAQRLRAIAVKLDAEQAKLDLAIDESSRRQ
jgi:hypothetical protein